SQQLHICDLATSYGSYLNSLALNAPYIWYPQGYRRSNMRLLERDAKGKFSLTKDFIKSIPAYAILSHTWGDDDQEVTYKDLAEGSGESKVGYKKLRFCGEQAARDHLRYFWVDTCCIDKSDVVELQKAINSMFR
ncbi:hypothetical protein B0O99DRAFT_120515, partial [Bisporella sp. PMI_857]